MKSKYSGESGSQHRVKVGGEQQGRWGGGPLIFGQQAALPICRGGIAFLFLSEIAEPGFRIFFLTTYVTGLLLQSITCPIVPYLPVHPRVREFGGVRAGRGSGCVRLWVDVGLRIVHVPRVSMLLVHAVPQPQPRVRQNTSCENTIHFYSHYSTSTKSNPRHLCVLFHHYPKDIRSVKNANFLPERHCSYIVFCLSRNYSRVSDSHNLYTIPNFMAAKV